MALSVVRLVAQPVRFVFGRALSFIRYDPGGRGLYSGGPGPPAGFLSWIKRFLFAFSHQARRIRIAAESGDSILRISQSPMQVRPDLVL